MDGDRALFFRWRAAKDRDSRNFDERILAQQAGDQKVDCRRLRGLEKLPLSHHADQRLPWHSSVIQEEITKQ
jgi:hypothetical protein